MRIQWYHLLASCSANSAHSHHDAPVISAVGFIYTNDSDKHCLSSVYLLIIVIIWLGSSLSFGCRSCVVADPDKADRRHHKPYTEYKSFGRRWKLSWWRSHECSSKDDKYVDCCDGSSLSCTRSSSSTVEFACESQWWRFDHLYELLLNLGIYIMLLLWYFTHIFKTLELASKMLPRYAHLNLQNLCHT